MARLTQLSDELYRLAQSTRVGIGHTLAAVKRALGAHQTVNTVAVDAWHHPDASGSSHLRQLQARDAHQVTHGTRSAKSLHVVTKNDLQGFTFHRQERAEVAIGDGW